MSIIKIKPTLQQIEAAKQLSRQGERGLTDMQYSVLSKYRLNTPVQQNALEIMDYALDMLDENNPESVENLRRDAFAKNFSQIKKEYLGPQPHVAIPSTAVTRYYVVVVDTTKETENEPKYGGFGPSHEATTSCGFGPYSRNRCDSSGYQIIDGMVYDFNCYSNSPLLFEHADDAAKCARCVEEKNPEKVAIICALKLWSGNSFRSDSETFVKP